MSGEWLDDLGFEIYRVPDNCGAYTYPDDGEKLTLHTTESDWGSLNAVTNLFMDGVLNAPQFCIDWNNGSPRMAQYMGLTRAGCALENRGCPTNGSGINVQVEIVGRAAFTQEWADDVLRFIADFAVKVNKGLKRIGYKQIPYVSELTFYGLDAGFTLATYNARQRLACDVYRPYIGWIGHQHTPGNAHWDPGKLKVQRCLAFARELDGGDDFMSDTQYQAVMVGLADLGAKVDAQTNTLGAWMKDSRGLIGGVALKKPGDDRQWLLAVTENGLVKYPIGEVAGGVGVIGTVEKDLMVKSEVVRDNLNLLELTDPTEIKVLDAIPITSAP